MVPKYQILWDWATLNDVLALARAPHPRARLSTAGALRAAGFEVYATFEDPHVDTHDEDGNTMRATVHGLAPGLVILEPNWSTFAAATGPSAVPAAIRH